MRNEKQVWEVGRENQPSREPFCISLPQFLVALSPFGMLSFLLEGDVFKMNRVLFPQKLKKVIEVGLIVLPVIYSTSIYY